VETAASRLVELRKSGKFGVRQRDLAVVLEAERVFEERRPGKRLIVEEEEWKAVSLLDDASW
jgi:hypothetical protein